MFSYRSLVILLSHVVHNEVMYGLCVGVQQAQSKELNTSVI